MIGKKLADLAFKPISAWNILRGVSYKSLNLNSGSDLTIESSYGNRNEQKSDQEDSENKYNNGNRYEQSSSQTNYNTSIIFPLILYMTNKFTSAKCLFSSDKPDRNKLKNRISLVQYPANNPIEDRWSCQQLESIDGYIVIVLDGHGGWQVAEFAKENLAKEIDTCLKLNKAKNYKDENEYITASIKEGFDIVVKVNKSFLPKETKFLEVAKEAYKLGFGNTGHVGACCLAVLVHNNKVYAANSGDCKGVIARQEKGGEIVLTKVNHKQNAGSKKEQARLRSTFKDEDIYVCRRGGNKACYVKNTLQPTRAFGDFRLKYPEFNNPKDLTPDFGKLFRYRRKILNFNGPYITHVPEVKIFDIDKSDKYLILSSDGMWDELNKEKVSKVVQGNLGDKIKISENLLEKALSEAAASSKMNQNELKNLPLGQRRDYHDDMTIIVVDLESQTK